MNPGPPAGPDDSPAPVPFGTRLAAAMTDRGPLCVGIDPHPHLLEQWGLGDDAAGVREFSLRALAAVAPRVAAVKPQVAFFERLGSAGSAILAEVVQTARELGVLCIIDAKRGDIGSTMAAYAQAFLGPDSDLAGDALTVSGYLGYGSLAPALTIARAGGGGLFVLALTSNPEGAAVQHARLDGITVAASVARLAGADNASEVADGAPMGSVGLVVGATVGDAPRRIGMDLAAVRGPLLAPGLGTQGGRVQDLPGTFGPALGHVLPTVSRSVLETGPDRADLAGAAHALAMQVAEITGRS